MTDEITRCLACEHPVVQHSTARPFPAGPCAWRGCGCPWAMRPFDRGSVVITVRVAPGVTLHGDTGAFTAAADAPPADVARLLRDLADDLDRQEER